MSTYRETDVEGRRQLPVITEKKKKKKLAKIFHYFRRKGRSRTSDVGETRSRDSVIDLKSSSEDSEGDDDGDTENEIPNENGKVVCRAPHGMTFVPMTSGCD